jgi:hypothetical protein
MNSIKDDATAVSIRPIPRPHHQITLPSAVDDFANDVFGMPNRRTSWVMKS